LVVRIYIAFDEQAIGFPEILEEKYARSSVKNYQLIRDLFGLNKNQMCGMCSVLLLAEPAHVIHMAERRTGDYSAIQVAITMLDNVGRTSGVRDAIRREAGLE
jgi:hypothetical protein